GRCRGDLEALTQHYGVPVVRGPEELKDLPGFFHRAARRVDLSRYEIAIFAEIVDAPRLTVRETVERARALAADGANVIDLGCLPETRFAHLEASVRALKRSEERRVGKWCVGAWSWEKSRSWDCRGWVTEA